MLKGYRRGEIVGLGVKRNGKNTAKVFAIVPAVSGKKKG